MHIVHNICELLAEERGGDDTLKTKTKNRFHPQCNSFKHGKKYNCFKLNYLNSCRSNILSVFPSYYDIINEMPVFGARMHP